MFKTHKAPTSSSIFFDPSSIPEPSAIVPLETAIIYCEGHFDLIAGKKANGLMRLSEKYKILSIIDDEKEGQDAGKILNGEPNGISVYRDLGTALAHGGRAPKHLIFGLTPASGPPSPVEQRMLDRAMKYGINIVTDCVNS